MNHRSMPPRRRAVTAVALLSLAACGSDSRDASFTLVDSAGVQIATSAAPAWANATGWRIDTVPLLDIGGSEDPSAQFGEIAGALLRDSGVVVADESDRTLRFFDARGALVATSGRKGAGPGEYEEISGVQRARDSLIVWDHKLRRVTLLDPAGRYVRSFVLMRDGTRGFPSPVGQWNDGRLLFVNTTGVSSGMPIGPVSDSLSVLRLGADGAGDSLLGRWRGRETVAVTSPRFVASLTLPYRRTTTVRTHPAGFWIGTGDDARIDRYDMNGRLVASVRWTATVTPVGSGELSAWRDSLLDGFEQLPAEFSSAFGKAARMVEFPTTRPPYRTFLVSGEDELWVQRVSHWRAGRAPTEWDIFDGQGRWLGALLVPAGVEPLEIRSDRLLAQ
jgi:hypothetical protein